MTAEQLPSDERCIRCGGYGYIPICCGDFQWDPNTFGGEICCGKFAPEACDQCDAWELLMADNPPVRREDVT